ncbi:MAG: MFS transporter [Mycobacterium sp.]
MRSPSRWFLPLMALAGVTLSLTAPLEVLFAREISRSSVYIGIFMLSAAIGVILVDIFGTRFIPGLDARIALIAGSTIFGVACIAMAVVSGGIPMMGARLLQGFGGGMMLGAGLQAAVRVSQSTDLVKSLGRFNAAFLFGGAVGAPGGLLIAGIIDGRVGYQVALAATGVLALLVATALTFALPRLPAPPGVPSPRLSLPSIGTAPGGAGALVLAMSGEFLRGGVLFTALPLAGAARGLSTLTITAAIAVMCATEIAVLAFAHRIIRRIGVFALLIGSLALGVSNATLIALAPPGAPTYLVAAALFGISLAGATASLPVIVVAQVGESAAGLARFRVSAGIGQLVGMVGCAVLGTQIGISALFAVIAVILLGCARLAHVMARRVAAT